jgi:hypothetical protein
VTINRRGAAQPDFSGYAKHFPSAGGDMAESKSKRMSPALHTFFLVISGILVTTFSGIFIGGV